MAAAASSANHSAERTDSGVALVPYQQQTASVPDLSFSERQIDLIKRLVAPGVTDDELALFLEVCRATGLNPLLKQVYAIKRKQRGEDGESVSRMTIQTGIDGYRLLASRTGALAGIDDAVYDREDGGHPLWARTTVWRFVQGQRVSFTATARWAEYAALGKDNKPIAMWARMPWLMLGKCAEALALRRAFPAELSGIYTGEEMAQADNPSALPYVEQAATPTPAPRQAAKPAPSPKPASPWKAMTDPDVIGLLDGIDIKGRYAVQTFLGTIKAEMEQIGLAWTRDQVLAHLRETYVAEPLDGATIANDLAQLDTGTPGN